VLYKIFHKGDAHMLHEHISRGTDKGHSTGSIRDIEPSLEVSYKKENLHKGVSKVFLAKLKKLLTYARYGGVYKLIAVAWEPVGGGKKEGIVELGTPSQFHVLLHYQEGGSTERIRYHLLAQRPDDGFSFHAKLKEALLVMEADEAKVSATRVQKPPKVSVPLPQKILAAAQQKIFVVLPPKVATPAPSVTHVVAPPPKVVPTVVVAREPAPTVSKSTPQFPNMYAFFEDAANLQKMFTDLAVRCGQKGASLTRKMVMDSIDQFGLSNPHSANRAVRRLVKEGFLCAVAEDIFSFGPSAAVSSAPSTAEQHIAPRRIEQPAAAVARPHHNSREAIEQRLEAIQAEKRNIVEQSHVLRTRHDTLKAEEHTLHIRLATMVEAEPDLEEINDLFKL